MLVNREIFGRLNTAAMLPTLERLCDRWAPDLILREPCEYAAAIAAERACIPHAQVAISLAHVEEGSLRLTASVLEAHLHGIVERLIASPYLTRFPNSMDPSPFPNTMRFHEPFEVAGRSLPEWWGGDDRPLIYVTLGSLAGGRSEAAPAYRALIEAVAPLPMRVLLTTGNDFDSASLPPLSPNVHVESWVAQQDVLRHASLVVCHGGSGTTFGALAAGIPLVIVPLFADQPVNARLVAEAGAGIAVAGGDVGPAGGDRCSSTSASGACPSPSRLREAIEMVIVDPSYRSAAKVIACEMRATPSVDDLLSTLLAARAGKSELRASATPGLRFGSIE